MSEHGAEEISNDHANNFENVLPNCDEMLADDEMAIEYRGKKVFQYDTEISRYFSYDRAILDGIASRIEGKRIPPECTSGFTYSDAVRYCYVNKLMSSQAMQVLKEANPTYYDAMQSCTFLETREYPHHLRDGSVHTEKANVYSVTFADKHYHVFVDERQKPIAFSDSAPSAPSAPSGSIVGQTTHTEFDADNCSSEIVSIYVRLAEKIHRRPIIALSIWGHVHKDDVAYDEQGYRRRCVQEKYVRYKGNCDVWKGWGRVARVVADSIYGDLRMHSASSSSYSLDEHQVYYWNEGREPKSTWEEEQGKHAESLARKERIANRSNSASLYSEEQQYLDDTAEREEQEAEARRLARAQSMEKLLSDWKNRESKTENQQTHNNDSASSSNPN
jgi:hypothetical protein